MADSARSRSILAPIRQVFLLTVLGALGPILEPASAQTDPPPSAPTGLQASTVSAGAEGFNAAGPILLAAYDSRWKGPGIVGSGSYPVSNFQVRGGMVEATGPWKAAAAYHENGQPADQESRIVDRAHSKTFKHAAVRMGPGRLGYSLYLSALSGTAYTRAYVQKDGRLIATAGSGSWSTAADHVLSIRASGSSPVTIEARVDGVLIGTATDAASPIASGYPGFWCGGAAESVSTLFDDWTDGRIAGDGIRLSWKASPETDVVSYSVYRTTNVSTGYSLLAKGIRTISYVDLAAARDARYAYVVVAVDAAGNVSKLSAVVWASPPPPAPTGLKIAVGAGNRDPFEKTGPIPLAVHNSRWKGPGLSGAVDYAVANFQVVNGCIQSTGPLKPAGAYYSVYMSPDQESQIIDGAHVMPTKHVAVRMGPGRLGYSLALGTRLNGVYTIASLYKDGKPLSISGRGAWSSSESHHLRIRAKGTAPVSLEAWVDGVKLGGAVDSSSPIVSGFPGFWNGGAADPSGASYDDWTDRSGPGGINISWSRSPDSNVSLYDVYRSVEGSAFVRIGTVSGTTFIDDGDLADGVTCTYAVIAIDASGGASPPSAMVSAIAEDRWYSFDLAWDPPLTNEDGTLLLDLAGFKVYQASGEGITDVIDTGNRPYLTIPPLRPGSYRFRVTAYDTMGLESKFSNDLLWETP